ncbi:MAG: ABC transporter substrate-binding protein, partial [Halobacteriaceae archaeon]
IPVFAPVNMFQQVSEVAPNMTIYCATANECIYPKVAKNVPNKTLQGSLGADFLPTNLSETRFAGQYTAQFGESTNVELGYAAFGYEQVIYLAKAMQDCRPSDGACLKRALETVQGYNSVIGTDGFDNGILQTQNQVLRYNESWQPVRS